MVIVGGKLTYWRGIISDLTLRSIGIWAVTIECACALFISLFCIAIDQLG